MVMVSYICLSLGSLIVFSFDNNGMELTDKTAYLQFNFLTACCAAVTLCFVYMNDRIINLAEDAKTSIFPLFVSFLHALAQTDRNIDTRTSWQQCKIIALQTQTECSVTCHNVT